MRQITRFAAVFAAGIALAASAWADPFRVNNIPVDKTAPTSADAQNSGREEARQVAAQRLINRLTLEQDRQGAREPLESLAVSRLFKNQITADTIKTTPVAGGFRATGAYSWVFDADKVRKYLEDRGVAYVDRQDSLALVIPVAILGVDPGQWAAQWAAPAAGGGFAGKTDDTALTPYVGATLAWNRRPQQSEIQEEMTRDHADHAIVAEAFMQGQQIYVRIVDMRTGADLGVAGPFTDLGSAQAGAVAAMEQAWKTASIVRTSGSTNMALIATFADVTEWVKIRKGLESSRLVKDLKFDALSNIGADISFTFAGRPEQLAADLRARGVDMTSDNGGWVLKVASAQ